MAHWLHRLLNPQTIAMVGASAKWNRPSYFAMKYLQDKGYRVIPVNPAIAGERLFGETVAPGLAAIPDAAAVDFVDIFRRSEFVPDIVDEALEHLPGLRTIWMQIGVEHTGAAARAEARGVEVIQNLCPKMEHQRLFGELRKAGIATGMISSRL